MDVVPDSLEEGEVQGLGGGPFPLFLGVGEVGVQRGGWCCVLRVGLILELRLKLLESVWAYHFQKVLLTDARGVPPYFGDVWEVWVGGSAGG